MVSSGSVSWTDGKLCERQEELIFPPRKTASTASSHIGFAVAENLEQYLFGAALPQALPCLAECFHAVGVYLVGDSAKSNLRVVRKFTSYLMRQAAEVGLVLTCYFQPCTLHQLMRVVMLLLHKREMSGALFSITRLHLSSTTKERTFQTMRSLLDRRFNFVPDKMPPDCRATDPFFRARLFELLAGDECLEEERILSKRRQNLSALLTFFNGDIVDKGAPCFVLRRCAKLLTDLHNSVGCPRRVLQNCCESEAWTHYCTGCHRSRAHALNDVPRNNLSKG